MNAFEISTRLTSITFGLPPILLIKVCLSMEALASNGALGTFIILRNMELNQESIANFLS